MVTCVILAAAKVWAARNEEVFASVEHLRVQFFSTTDAGPEHEFETQVLMQNLKTALGSSVVCAFTEHCKPKVKPTASI